MPGKPLQVNLQSALADTSHIEASEHFPPVGTGSVGGSCVCMLVILYMQFDTAAGISVKLHVSCRLDVIEVCVPHKEMRYNREPQSKLIARGRTWGG